MRFELDDTLMDEILFFMENQEGDFLLDTQEVNVVDIYNYDYDEEPEPQPSARTKGSIREGSPPDFSDEDRFISLPEWDSQDGYRLMESFSSGLKNPIVRQELSAALNRSKGVFRAFRDVLSQYPEAEKMWYTFKDQKMKGAVLSWYNALREEWGMEPVGAEPEDNSSLIFEDFFIHQGTEEFSFLAETVNGDSAGAINARLEEKDASFNGDDDSNNKSEQVLHVNYLEVNPVYRGMGLGKALLSKVLEKADEQKLDVSIDLPSVSDFFSRSLHLENFKPVMKKFLRESGKY